MKNLLPMKNLVIPVLVVTALAGCVQQRRPDKSPMQRKIDAMFQAADQDADEWLTPAELDGGFPWLAGKFAEVDTDNNGKVSLAEVSSYIVLQRMQTPEPRKKR
jgi:hypothetical protein